MFVRREDRIARWYFGGLAGSGAACITHPLDLLKVHLQTQQEARMGIVKMTVHIVRNQGVLALYSGISASILRQLTYSTTRFAFYEVAKQAIIKPGESLPFSKKVLLAGLGGAAGGIAGTPADMVNVRMQNDIKLPMEQRRNYKNAIHGLWQVYKHEGISALFNGTTMATSRAIVVTIGQVGFYDQVKEFLLSTGVFSDNFLTHFTSSFIAGGTATALSQPLDVLKTRLMNAKPGEYRGIGHCALVIAKLGPLGFFKGFVPAFVRLAPHTILLWMFLEQMRLYFGYIPLRRD
jgi:dicarboxylate transporter 10